MSHVDEHEPPVEPGPDLDGTGDVVEASDPVSAREEAEELGFVPFDPTAHPRCAHCAARPEAVRYVRHDGKLVRGLICSMCARLYE
jgi:hypothetical protein